MPDVFEHRRETAVQLAHRDALFDRETRAVACRGHRGHLGIRDVQFNLEAVRAELAELRRRCGEPGSAARAAEKLLEALKES